MESGKKKRGRKAVDPKEKKVPLTISVKARHHAELKAEFEKLAKAKELAELIA